MVDGTEIRSDSKKDKLYKKLWPEGTRHIEEKFICPSRI